VVAFPYRLPLMMAILFQGRILGMNAHMKCFCGGKDIVVSQVLRGAGGVVLPNGACTNGLMEAARPHDPTTQKYPNIVNAIQDLSRSPHSRWRETTRDDEQSIGDQTVPYQSAVGTMSVLMGCTRDGLPSCVVWLVSVSVASGGWWRFSIRCCR
jgi:hypothetical protein